MIEVHAFFAVVCTAGGCLSLNRDEKSLLGLFNLVGGALNFALLVGLITGT